MSWTLSANGHANDAEQESDQIEILRAAVRQANAAEARMGTQHHGQVDLLAPGTGEQQAETEP